MRLIDYSGKRFGNLKVIERAADGVSKSGNKEVRWLCECDCGKKCIVFASCIRRGTDSCGCKKNQKIGLANTKHGLSDSPLYFVHSSMLARCYNSNSDSYEHYGGRGITVCDEWQGENGFLNFYSWAMKSGYKKGLTIERKNFNDGYSPQNCTWASRAEQACNKRDTHFVTYKGETKPMSFFLREYHISRKTLVKYENQFNGDSEKAIDYILNRRKRRDDE